MRAKALCLVLLLIAPAPMVQAQGTSSEDQAAAESWDGAGFYLGLGAALGFQTGDLDLGKTKPAGGFQAVAGYKILPFLAAEIETEWLTYAITKRSITQANYDPIVLTANVKGILPLDSVENLEPYALVGVGATWGKLTDKATGASTEPAEFVARFAVGFDLLLTERVTLGFDATYVLPTGSLDDFGYVSIGLFKLGYRF